ncbi:alternative NADH-dehydrogenase [Sarocladium strictum]
MLVWATGNTIRPIIRDLLSKIPEQKDSRRGLAVDEYLTVKGTSNIWAVGDCAVAGYAPTVQVAAQEGKYLAQLFNSLAQTEWFHSQLPAASCELSTLQDRDTDGHKGKSSTQTPKDAKAFKPFSYSHQGSLAYIGSDKAVADVVWMNNNLATAGKLTYWFWRSAYLSMCFSARNRILVMLDWFKSKAFGRDVSRRMRAERRGAECRNSHDACTFIKRSEEDLCEQECQMDVAPGD